MYNAALRLISFESGAREGIPLNTNRMPMKTLTALSVVAIATALNASAGIVFTTDFESGVPPEFGGAGSLTSTEGYSAYGFEEYYLRNDSAGAPTSLAIAGLPDHSYVDIWFDAAIIDSWDGDTIAGGTVPPDYFNVSIDGLLAFSETFDNFDWNDQSWKGAPIVYRADPSLAQNTGWLDSAYPFIMSVPHSGDTLLVEWFASGGGWQAGADESWAIDNIKVSVQTTSIPDGGGSLGLLGLAFFGLAVLKKR